MKIIYIKECRDCGNFKPVGFGHSQFVCSHKKVFVKPWFDRVVADDCNKRVKIPKWCPLEDAK